MRTTVAAILTFVVAVGIGDSWAGAEPAGMVLDVAGFAEPLLQRFAELSDRAVYRLAPSTHLLFVHYRTCRVVSLVGGALRIEQGRYDVDGGRIESEELRPCPQQYVVRPNKALAGTTGALLLRSGGADTPILSPRLDVILTGAHADRFSAAEIRRDDDLVAHVPLPRSRHQLSPGGGYRLVLFRAGDTRVEVPFVVVEPSASPELDRLLIVRIE